MTYEEIQKRLSEEFQKLQQINADFTPGIIDEDDVWFENLEDPEWKGKVPYGSLSNYLIFIEKKDDGLYMSLVVETEPAMITYDWLCGGGLSYSDCNYEFSGSAYDVAADYSYDDAESVFEVKL